MLKYLEKYSIVTIVPLKKCVYFYTKLPVETKLSTELLALNYKNKSPFQESSLMNIVNKEHLSIWFTVKKYYKTPFILPEGYLYYKAISKLGNGLYTVSIVENKKLLLLIKDDILLLQFFISSQKEVEIVENQYKQSAQDISEKNSKKLLEVIYKEYKLLLELRHFIKINFSKESVKNIFIEKFSYPLIFVMLLYIAITYFQSYKLQKKIDTLTQTYRSLKTKNSFVKKSIKEHNQKVKKLKIFAKNELNYLDSIKFIVSLEKIIEKDEKAKVVYINMHTNSIQIRIETKEKAIKYFRRLDTLGYFKDIIIENTHRKRDGTKVYSYALVPKVSL